MGGHTPLSIVFTLLFVLAFLLACWALFRRADVSVLSGRGATAEAGHPLRGVLAIEWAGLVVFALAFGPQTNSPHLSLLLLPRIVAVAVLGIPDGGDRSAAPLILGLVLLAAGLSLPPGGIGLDPLVAAWRSVAGPCWCALAMYLTLLAVGLPRASGAGR